MRKQAWILVTIFLILGFSITGCNSSEAITFFNQNIGKYIGLKLDFLNTPAPKVTNEPELPSPDHRKVNAEFLKELFRVVVKRDLVNEEEFAKYMNVLDQGGHFEGIYNGIVYASEYRLKETGVATVSALKLYAEIMAQIILDQKYDPLKIPKPESVDVPTPESKDPIPPQPTDAERAQLIADYEKEGMTKSFYTLKRRLGEEVLKTIELKREYKEKFSTWYGRFTVFLNKKGVDFGLPQRNRTEEYFHYKWALDAEEDRLKWECLNRVHVLMNSVK